MARTALSRPDALASLVTPHSADVSPITTPSDDDVIASRVENVVVDLAWEESPDVGTVVDLAQRDARYSEAPRLPAAGHSPHWIGAARRPLSPSGPSAIRLANTFGTADLIDDPETPEHDRSPLDGTGHGDRAVPDDLGRDLVGEPHRPPHRRTPRFLLYGATRLGAGDGERTAYARKESTMYIGAGTLVVILIVVVIVMLLRGR